MTTRKETVSQLAKPGIFCFAIPVPDHVRDDGPGIQRDYMILCIYLKTDPVQQAQEKNEEQDAEYAHYTFNTKNFITS